jgi:hypothetical protein
LKRIESQKNILKCTLITGLLFLAITNSLMAQASLVPAHHPVYDWLYHQRVAGYLPGYNYERLPLTRGEIIRHLHRINDLDVLRGTQSVTLHTYLREFDPAMLHPDTGHQAHIVDDTLSWPGGSIRERRQGLWTDEEKHLILFRSDDGYLFADVGLGMRTFAVHSEGSLTYRPVSILKHARVAGNFKGWGGIHGQVSIASPIGDDAVYAYDGFYSHNWISQQKFARGNPQGQTLVNFEGSASVRFGNTVGLAIGRGNLKVGTGVHDNVAFSRNAYPLDWIRLDIGNRWVQYQMIHGAMGWPFTIRVTNDSDDRMVVTRNSPQRFVVMHSYTFHPFPWMAWGLYEMTNYSNRGMETAYLNPINIISFAERDLWDQDNGWGGAWGVLRPLRGLELYTELLIDDLSGHRDLIFKKRHPETSRFGRRYGVQWVVVPNLRLFGDYERIDPFLYTHPYTMNAHTNGFIGLGSQLAPNSDRLSTGARWMGARRTWIELTGGLVRQGRDIFDEDGNLIFYAGGDVNIGRRQFVFDESLTYDESYLFLDGELHRWAEVQVDASWEPMRGVILSGRMNQRWLITGSQLGNRTVLWIDFDIGF